MKSRRAKVLHEVAGQPLISHVVGAALGLSAESICVVVGYQADEVERAVRDKVANSLVPGSPAPELCFAVQQEQRGTGHAVMAAREHLQKRTSPVIILAGDGPLIQSSTLGRLVENHLSEANDATLLTVELEDPRGYGRIIRGREGEFVRIVEQKDATPEESAVREVAVSIYCFNPSALLSGLDGLTTDNAQGEYYLTDVPRVIQSTGGGVGLVRHSDAIEVLGINTRIELAELERMLRERKLRELMLSGVTIVDPASTYIHQEVEIGADSVIHPQVIIEGRTKIGSDCTIESWTRLKNVALSEMPSQYATPA